jgi:hypothetical protein
VVARTKESRHTFETVVIVWRKRREKEGEMEGWRRRHDHDEKWLKRSTTVATCLKRSFHRDVTASPVKSS